MNYRHAFHAGNHTELFKHAVLVFLLEHLLAKPKPFMVLDSHAGLGMYDLDAPEAIRTGEKAEGIERVYPDGLAACPLYGQIVRAVNEEGPLRRYPGSPEIIRRLLRPGDRLIATELHPQDHAALAARFRGLPGVIVQQRNGYEAVNALVPPRERRGLVFIDPPFERKDETEIALRTLARALRKWATGMFCLWYPIKDNAIGDRIATFAREAGWPKAMRLECRPFRQDGVRLCGSGMLLCNTPWTLPAKAEALMAELCRRLGDGDGSWTLESLAASG